MNKKIDCNQMRSYLDLKIKKLDDREISMSRDGYVAWASEAHRHAHLLREVKSEILQMAK